MEFFPQQVSPLTPLFHPSPPRKLSLSSSSATDTPCHARAASSLHQGWRSFLPLCSSPSCCWCSPHHLSWCLLWSLTWFWCWCSCCTRATRSQDTLQPWVEFTYLKPTSSSSSPSSRPKSPHSIPVSTYLIIRSSHISSPKYFLNIFDLFKTEQHSTQTRQLLCLGANRNGFSLIS